MDSQTQFIQCVGINKLANNLQDAASFLLPLKSIKQQIFIINALANVQIEQIFINNTQHFLQVQYKFPVSPKACFYQFVGVFGNKRIQGVVKEKQEAKKQYSQGLKQGKKVGYGQVDEKSKDIMKVQFGNIPPNQEMKVQIKYCEQLSVYLNTAYKFDLVTNLNPRYSNSPSYPNQIGNVNNKTKAISAPFEHSLNVRVTAMRKIQMYHSSTHELIQISKNLENNEYRLTIKKGTLLKKDFSFMYSTEDFHLPSYTMGKSNEVTTVMLSFIPKYFAENVQDIKKAAKEKQNYEVDIDSAKGEYLFLLDRSGSMGGKRMQNAKKSLILFIKSLPVDSYFNIVSFGSSYEFLFDHSRKNEIKSVKQAIKLIELMNASMGGTEIEYPLKTVLASEVIEGYPKQVFLLTDGDVSNTEKVIDLVRKNIKYSRVHCIGIGEGASRALIQGCAEKGKGYCVFIKDQEDPNEKIIQLLNDSLSPVLNKIDLKYDKNLVVNIVPNPESIPYILKNDLAHFYITFKGQLKNKTLISLSYLETANNQQFISQLQIYPSGLSECFVAKMGHFRTLLALQDAQAEGKKVEQNLYFVKNVNIKQQIINLSIKHQILSKFTSFLFVQKQLLDGEYQQIKDKGQFSVKIGEKNAQVENYPKVQQIQPMAYSNVSSDQDESYVDECAFAFEKKPQKELKKEKKSSFKQEEGNYQAANKQKIVSEIDLVVSQQQVQGFWNNPMLIQKLFSEDVYNFLKQKGSSSIIITYLLAQWMEKNHNKPALQLIIKKAKNWLKKQPDIKVIESYFKDTK